MMIKGSLLLSAPVVKRFRSNNCPVLDQNLTVYGINRGLILNLSFITPKGTSLHDDTFNELSRIKILQPV